MQLLSGESDFFDKSITFIEEYEKGPSRVNIPFIASTIYQALS